MLKILTYSARFLINLIDSFDFKSNCLLEVFDVT